VLRWRLRMQGRADNIRTVPGISGWEAGWMNCHLRLRWPRPLRCAVGSILALAWVEAIPRRYFTVIENGMLSASRVVAYFKRCTSGSWVGRQTY